MLLAIDLGNSETTVGVWDGAEWRAVWRRETSIVGRSDTFDIWLRTNLAESQLATGVEGAILASVVPAQTEGVERAVRTVCGMPTVQLRHDPRLGMEIRYSPPDSLGADRLANALGARALLTMPALVVDVGTATTFEALDRGGAFVGGAIMPGPKLMAAALAHGTAALPEAAIELPAGPIGGSTLTGLQSGIVLGHAAAIQSLATSMVAELGADTTVVATGGFGERFLPLCPVLSRYLPTLTLDGLVVAFGLLSA
ncbi:MAG TPA: type III pantothenate kinase [Fimbriimonadaceae bacterium]|nr:type III pantothenate kinase [Fimbriimonadaceae bacterium]